jgi:Methyltransferase domain
METVRPQNCDDSEAHFRPHVAGVNMSANNAKSGDWCRLPSRSFSSRCVRMKVVPRWFPDLWQIVPHFATKESRRIPIACEIRSYQEYEFGYRKLANALGRAGSKPAPRELELLRLLIDRRTNPAGSLGLADCLFMTAFVSVIRPRRMIEIGTGSGFSSAVLACAMDPAGANSCKPCVDTLDAHATYFGDRELPVGFEIPRLIGEFPGSVRVHAPRQSDYIGNLASPNELETAFIDANHQHPCPLLDLLRIVPYVRSAGWILLHDIRLGTLVEEFRKNGVQVAFEAVYGAEWLFEEWPWTKIDGGNIGAIQLPTERKAICGPMRRLMKRPFETCEQSYRPLRDEVGKAARMLS